MVETRARGFTLVEILVVVAIIGILAAIGIPAMLRSRMAANEAAAISDVQEAFKSSGSAGEPIVCPSPPGRFGGTKSGYVRGCTAGVFWATPQVQSRTGVRGFGIDGTGRTCFTTDGSIPVLSGACTTLQ